MKLVLLFSRAEEGRREEGREESSGQGGGGAVRAELGAVDNGGDCGHEVIGFVLLKFTFSGAG